MFVALPKSPVQRWARACLLLGIVSALFGCGRRGELLVPVEGVVTLKGRPLHDGAVSFRPDTAQGNRSLHQPTGAIQPDGRYRLFVGHRAGAPPGHYKVVIFANEAIVHEAGSVHPGMPKSLIDRRYNAPTTTPLAVEVVPHEERVSLDFDLEPAA